MADNFKPIFDESPFEACMRIVDSQVGHLPHPAWTQLRDTPKMFDPLCPPGVTYLMSPPNVMIDDSPDDDNA